MSKKDVNMSLRQVTEGQLLKYTNIISQYQPRWFVLEPRTGMLEYFMSEGEKKQRPRASLHLAGAIVVPSEEDSYTFSVNAANEDAFKLRAVDARERQYWINRLRVVAQAHTQVLAESNPPLFRDHSQLSSTLSTASAVSNSPYTATPAQPTQKMLSCNLTVLDAFSSVRDYLRRVECEHQRLIHSVEDLPSSGPTATCTDTELLLLKATSQATLLCLEQCLAILHYQQQQPNKPQVKANSLTNSPLLGSTKKAMEVKKITSDFPRLRSESAVSVLSDKTLMTGGAEAKAEQWPETSSETNNIIPSNDDESEYVLDELAVSGEGDRPINEEYKVRTLKLLSQLKLGMELTRVNLPVFFCEPRSVLQVLSDAFRQPQLLLSAAKEAVNPEQRMAKVVKWYLGCIRACQIEMAASRKPFNPTLGETFKCIWNLKDGKENSGEVTVFRFQAEQVSHNPPISAFHLECPQQNISLQGNVSVQAKFMGMYVGTTLGGELVLELSPKHPSEDRVCLEKYEMSYPTLYLRSLLSEPWMEFGGKITINCPETKVSTGLTFQTKPFYGGKPHQVTAEIKGANGNTTGRLSGDWLVGVFELSWLNGQAESIDLSASDGWLEKKVRPIARQRDDESLKLWYPVRRALAAGDFQAAADHKKMIEERQREKERKCTGQGIVFRPIYFQRDNEIWIWKK